MIMHRYSKKQAKIKGFAAFVFLALMVLSSCGPLAGDIVQVSSAQNEEVKIEAELDGLRYEEIELIEEIKEVEEKEKEETLGLKNVIEETPNYSVAEYLERNPGANNHTNLDFTVGGYDVIDITVYGEDNLSRENVRISADGYISFPFIGRVMVDGLSTSEIERRIAGKLAEGQYILDAHVSVTVREYNSKRFHVLGSVKSPGVYPLKGKERLLDAISRAGGVDESAGKEAMIIRTENSNFEDSKKIVIRLDLNGLLKMGDQLSNILLTDQDLLFIPKAERFNIIGQVKNPGAYPYLEKEITLVEAISMAGGFTPIAARNRTRIIRIEDGEDKIIQIKVDAITEAGKKGHDIPVRPGDVIVVPESFF